MNHCLASPLTSMKFKYSSTGPSSGRGAETLTADRVNSNQSCQPVISLGGTKNQGKIQSPKRHPAGGREPPGHLAPSLARPESEGERDEVTARSLLILLSRRDIKPTLTNYSHGRPIRQPQDGAGGCTPCESFFLFLQISSITFYISSDLSQCHFVIFLLLNIIISVLFMPLSRTLSHCFSKSSSYYHHVP